MSSALIITIPVFTLMSPLQKKQPLIINIIKMTMNSKSVKSLLFYPSVKRKSPSKTMVMTVACLSAW